MLLVYYKLILNRLDRANDQLASNNHLDLKTQILGRVLGECRLYKNSQILNII